MAFNSDQNESSEDDRYKLHDNYSSEGLDSETETTLLGYVHYSSVSVSSQAQPNGSTKIPPESQDLLKEESALKNLKEVTLSIRPTQPIVEIPRERFIADPTHFAFRTRYFSEAGPNKCFKCKKPGHVQMDCPLNKKGCLLCKNHHHTLSECPWTLCTNCKQFGHSEQICSSDSSELHCSHCNSNKHDTKSCRVFWREYSDLNQPKISGRLPKWCYQCGEMNHFGDSCKFGYTGHTTSFCGIDSEDPIGKGKARISHVHALFLEPIFSDMAPETAASAPENRSRFRNNDRHTSINHRLSFSSNSDHRYKTNNYRNDGFGSRSDLHRRTDNSYDSQDRYRSFASRDSVNHQNKRNFKEASPRNGPKYGYSDNHHGFK